MTLYRFSRSGCSKHTYWNSSYWCYCSCCAPWNMLGQSMVGLPLYNSLCCTGVCHGGTRYLDCVALPLVGNPCSAGTVLQALPTVQG